MIGVKKISHASYETPDLEQQVDITPTFSGSSLIAREQDAVYLASTVDHHSVILRNGSHPRCPRIGFQLGIDDDLERFREADGGAWHSRRRARRTRSRPSTIWSPSRT